LAGIGLSISRGSSEAETEVIWIVVTVEESSAIDGCCENGANKKAVEIKATILRWFMEEILAVFFSEDEIESAVNSPLE
jgi:hypothetical protein